MDEKREEVYERIPWETLEDKGRDRQWIALGIAAAIVAGAVGYSFVSNRAVSPPAAPVAASTAPPVVTVPPAASMPAPAAPPSSTAPSVVAEADLFAVDPLVLSDAAAAHARWVVREYLTVDGSPEGATVLRSLLPEDVPLPMAPPGTLVFVEWVESVGVEEIDVATFRVSVIARYMVSVDGGDYVRSEPELLSMDISMLEGMPRALSAPTVEPISLVPAPGSGLGDVPATVAAAVEVAQPGSQIVGGRQLLDGSWSVVVIASGPAGIMRPESVVVTP